MGIMKTLLLYHIKQISWQSISNEEVLGIQMFIPKVGLSGLKIHVKVHERTKIQFLEKIKLDSKILPPESKSFIILLLYHLKQTSWQSMHKWSFRTSKFTLMLSGLKFFWVQKHTKIRFFKKKIGKYFLGKKGNGLFFNLKQVSLNSDENWSSYKSLYLEVTSSWSSTRTTTIRGYF